MDLMNSSINIPSIIQNPAERENKISEALGMLRTVEAQKRFITLCEEYPDWVIFSHCGVGIIKRNPCAGLVNWKTGGCCVVEDKEGR